MDPILIGTAVFWTRDQGNEQTCCTIGQSTVTNDYLINIHENVMINN